MAEDAGTGAKAAETRPRRLLFVSRAYWPAERYGGPITSLRRICSMLVDAGHEVTVVCSNMAEPGMRGRRLPAGRFTVDGVRVEYLNLPIRVHWEGLGWGARRAILRAIRAADIVNVMGTRHFLGVVAEMAARRAGTPYLTFPEGSVPARGRNRLVKRAFDRLHTRRALADAFRVVATSDAEAEDLSRWDIPMGRILTLPPRAERVALSPESRESLRAKWNIPPGVPTLVWMGRVHPVKGLPVLFDALADPRLADTHLLLAGEPEDRPHAAALRARTEAPPLAGRVRFVGWADAGRKGELFKLADAFVFPSERENFGLAAAEATASGLPVIVTEGCGIAPLVRDRAGLVCRQDPGQLAEVIHAYVSNPSLQAQLRAGAIELAPTLEWSRLIKRLQHTYEIAPPKPSASTNPRGASAIVT